MSALFQTKTIKQDLEIMTIKQSYGFRGLLHATFWGFKATVHINFHCMAREAHFVFHRKSHRF